jgi:arylsulfatase A-like enzyme
MDILPTFAKISGGKVDKDRIIDGKNIWPIMAGEKGAKSPHQVFYYYRIAQLQAVRSGKWKLCLPLKNKSKVSIFRLYDLKADLGEKNNLADKHPEVVKRLAALAEKAREELGDKDRPGKGQRPAGWVDNPKPMLLPKYDK